MKKLILIAAFAFGTYLVSAQAPEKMSYQAVVRNATGQLVQNQNVGIKASVLQNSATGTVVYSERLTGTTNANGLVNLAIGSGTVLSGTFPTIDWSTGNYYLKTETDPTGGTNYTIAGTSQLLSVPYAMYAKTSGSGSGISGTNNKISKFTSANTLGNSQITDDGTSVGINVPTLDGSVKFTVLGTSETATAVVQGEGPSYKGTLRGVNTVTGTTSFTSAGVEGIAASGIGVKGTSVDGYGVSSYSRNNRAGDFLINNPNNNNSALKASSVSSGAAIEGESYGATGIAGLFSNINPTNPGLALKTVGKVQLKGINEAAGRVLTSDASGNATWQDASKNVQFKLDGLRTDFNIPTTDTPITVWKLTPTYNDGGGTYDSNTGTYTVPKTGLYQVFTKIAIPSGTSPSVIGIRIKVNSLDSEVFVYTAESTYATNHVPVQATLQLNQGDTVRIAISQSTNVTRNIIQGNSTSNTFSLYLIR